MQYCEIDDFYQRASLQMNPYYIGLTLSEKTKHQHSITGWVCVTGIYPDGRNFQLFDIWSGFNKQYLNQISMNLFLFCQRIGINYK